MKDISPCPWCGGDAETTVSSEYSYVRCKNNDCFACGPNFRSHKWRYKTQRAIEAWNRVSDAISIKEHRP